MNRLYTALTAFCLLAAMLVLLPACQTTGDPKQGGLFGWSEDKAQQRIEQKEHQKASLETEQAVEQTRTGELENQKMLAAADRDALAGKVKKLDRDVAQLETTLQKTKAETEAAQLRKWEITTKLKAAKRELAEVKTDPDTAAKQAEVQRLEAELDRLLKETEALSTF